MITYLAEIGQWLQRHDVTIDLITVWALAVGFCLFGIAKLFAWWTLQGQADQTMVGVTLKKQKLTEALIGFGMSTLYGMTLFAYYAAGPQFDFWDRLLLRLGLFMAMLLGSYYSVRFVYWLRKESNGKGGV